MGRYNAGNGDEGMMLTCRKCGGIYDTAFCKCLGVNDSVVDGVWKGEKWWKKHGTVSNIIGADGLIAHAVTITKPGRVR